MEICRAAANRTPRLKDKIEMLCDQSEVIGTIMQIQIECCVILMRNFNFVANPSVTLVECSLSSLFIGHFARQAIALCPSSRDVLEIPLRRFLIIESTPLKEKKKTSPPLKQLVLKPSSNY